MSHSVALKLPDYIKSPKEACDYIKNLIPNIQIKITGLKYGNVPYRDGIAYVEIFVGLNDEIMCVYLNFNKIL
jgi:hypothetical protein